MGTSIALSITLLMLLPLSNAIDDAPNHLYVIYQASVTFFAALIAFQVVFRQNNTTFDVFIKAIDRYFENTVKQLQDPAKENTKPWTKLSETEKELLLAKVVVSYYLNKKERKEPERKNEGSEAGEIEPKKEEENGEKPIIDLTDEKRDAFQCSSQCSIGGHRECFSRCCRGGSFSGSRTCLVDSEEDQHRSIG